MLLRREILRTKQLDIIIFRRYQMTFERFASLAPFLLTIIWHIFHFEHNQTKLHHAREKITHNKKKKVPLWVLCNQSGLLFIMKQASILY